MPGRKRKQSYPRQRRRPPASETRPSQDGGLDDAARQLSATHSVEELQGLVAQAQEACEQADREAQEQPSPTALRRYRSASVALAEAQRALVLGIRLRAD